MTGLQWVLAPLRVLAFLMALGAAALSFLALGGVISRWLDVLTHFAPLYLALALAGLLLRLATGLEGSRPTMTLGLAGAAFAFALVAPELWAMARQAPPPANGVNVKLLQFNLWSRNPDPQGTARWIAAQGADVVVLEEAEDSAAVIPDLLKAQYPFSTNCLTSERCGTVILTREKPAAAGSWQAAPFRLPGVWVTMGAGAGAFTVAGVHYTWPVPPGGQQQQAQRLADAAAQFDQKRLIVAGDMNSTPWSFSLRRQDVRLGLERRTRALFSWPVAPTYGWTPPLPLLAIDQVYAGSDWKTVSVKAGPRQGSDHLPVTVVLRRAR